MKLFDEAVRWRWPSAVCAGCLPLKALTTGYLAYEAIWLGLDWRYLRFKQQEENKAGRKYLSTSKAGAYNPPRHVHPLRRSSFRRWPLSFAWGSEEEYTSQTQMKIGNPVRIIPLNHPPRPGKYQEVWIAVRGLKGSDWLPVKFDNVREANRLYMTAHTHKTLSIEAKRQGNIVYLQRKK